MMVLSVQEAYAILDLQTGASEDDIINSYKNLALAWHPDKHNGSDLSFEEFYKINNAYRRLTITDESEISKPLTKEKMFEIFQDVFIKKKTSKQNGYSSFAFGEEDCNGDGFDDDFIGASYNNKNKNIGLPEKGEDKLPVTVEDAQRNAESLVAEVEKEKNKAERRRAKKKRRKEKRKSEKETSGGQQENKKDTSNPSQLSSVKNRRASRSSSEDTESEEELDTKSPFIATAATKIKNVNPLSVRNNNISKNEKLLVRDDSSKEHRAEDTDPSVLQSRRLAIRGNEMANVENFTAAVELFSEAIRINPKDFRFYGNRSFCYDRLGLYDKALKDADKAIQLNPDWPKNYHRKGRALAGLKKFAEAEVAFDHVLKLDKDCEDAKQELMKVRTEQILEMGFTKQQAETALRWFGSVPAALDSLLNGAGTSARTILDSLVAAAAGPGPINEVYVSDEENQNSPMVMRTAQPHMPPDIKMDPRNPEGLTSLWVGNISKEIKEKTLKQLFGQYGTVLSLRIIPEKFCAFINYSDKNSAGRAMKALQGVMFGGQNLLIRFPDKPISNGHPVLKKATTKLSVSASTSASGKPQPKATGPVNGDECYFWRTTGCIYGDSCCYKHLPHHKGIDKKPWQTA